MIDRSGVLFEMPLTPMQEGMLYHHLRDRSDGTEVLQVVGRCDEVVDPARFEEALRHAVAEFEALRTILGRAADGRSIQRVLAESPIELRREDWSGLDAETAEARLANHLDADRRRGFDLYEPPLWRFLIAERGSQTICVLTHHHVTIDGRSERRILDRVFTLYDALMSGAPLPPVGEDRVFRAHVEALGRAAFERSIEALAAELEPWLDAAAAPRAHGGDPKGFGHGCAERELPATTAAALRALAGRLGLGASVLVQAAFARAVAAATGRDAAIFGQVRSGRNLVQGARDAVGNFINTCPTLVVFDAERTAADFLLDLNRRNRDRREREHLPLAALSSRLGGAPLFETALIFDTYRLENAFVGRGGRWEGRRFRLFDQPSVPLALYAYDESSSLLLRLSYDRKTFGAEPADRLVGSVAAVLGSLAENGAETKAAVSLSTLEPFRRDELRRVASGPALVGSGTDSLVDLLRARFRTMPEAPALAAGGLRLTYGALGEAAARAAAGLRRRGIGPGKRVGISMRRGPDLIVGLLAVLESGAAYVPLDPDYPAERIAFMIADADPALVLVDDRSTMASSSSVSSVTIEELDGDGTSRDPEASASTPAPDDPAYVLYTSGSTGRPKGVVVRHRNVVAFFEGLDHLVPGAPGDRFLAVTSISFDISVLEIFWSLTRGLECVLAGEAESFFAAAEGPVRRAPEFSLFFFAGSAAAGSDDKYALFREAAQFADRNGFSAVWTPERHFHDFGGLYPNPAVTGAALAAWTTNVEIRAGSVVLPLQDPIRVAEEWSVVDNLSNGRAAVSFASGWHARDFVLAPDAYADRVKRMYEGVETVRRLWSGEAIARKDGAGQEVLVRLFPRPHRRELPVWITSGGHIETFRSAGRIGANVLTHFLGQDLTAVSEKIAAYRAARSEAGFDPTTGKVALMVHAFLGESREAVKRIVREPLVRYLDTSADLVDALAKSLGQGASAGSLTAAERAEFLERRFDRYFEKLGLFGTIDDGLRFVDALTAAGVDDIACLVDFGVPRIETLESLKLLARLRDRIVGRAAPKDRQSTLAEILAGSRPTHLQSTPSLARMMLADPATRGALAAIRHWLVGGEAFPKGLLPELRQVTEAQIYNMYGPTETTIWSLAAKVESGDDPPPIGRPLAGQHIRIVDERGELAPYGAPGELWIGGAGVAAGYHARPELTAERFRRRGDEIFYRTGDLVRRRADGAVEFLGRSDTQVKWRGHRIELGEIEHALGACAGVREAAVVLRQDEPREPRLTAYVVWSDASRRDGAEALRAELRRRLPEIMVPQDYVRLDRLPMTPNQKIDRRALPRPAAEALPSGRVVVAPVGATETRLLGIWKRILNVSELSATDDWFDRGGHSLMAVQLAADVGREFGVSLALSALFRAPTVRGLAAEIEAMLLAGRDAATLADALAAVESLSDEDLRRLLDEPT